jgi:hypothetical protein
MQIGEHLHNLVMQSVQSLNSLAMLNNKAIQDKLESANYLAI